MPAAIDEAACVLPTDPATDEDGGRRPHNPAAKTPRDLLERIPIGHPDSMMSAESVRRAAEEFRTRPTDVIVATFPKTGTTLVTWICHLLRTGAREATSSIRGFETFYEVVPWPMLSWDVGIDPNVRGGEFVPRVFKSHLRMASIYPGCKYVVTVRDPGKTALSFYNFFIAKRVPFLVDASADESTDAEPKLLMNVSEFLVDTKFVRGSPLTPSSGLRASIWEYYAEYHSLMECPSVLMLVYEDFISDDEARSESIRTLGKFMGVLDSGTNTDTSNNHDIDQLIARTASMSTKAYMAGMMSKFDEPYERAKALNRAADVSQMAPGAKVALQTHSQTFDDRANRFLEDQWRAAMEPLGYSDYASFCVALRKRNKKLFG